MIRERTYQMSAEPARQDARMQQLVIRIGKWTLAAEAIALAFGLIPMNDITIMLAMALPCGALLRILYRL